MNPSLLAGIAATQEGITFALAEMRDLLNRLADRSDAITRNLNANRTDGPTPLEAAMHSVWLHGKWSWLTQKMTTEEREAAADAVQRYSDKLAADSGETWEPIDSLRWWRQ